MHDEVTKPVEVAHPVEQAVHTETTHTTVKAEVVVHEETKAHHAEASEAEVKAETVKEESITVN